MINSQVCAPPAHLQPCQKDITAEAKVQLPALLLGNVQRVAWITLHHASPNARCYDDHCGFDNQH